MMTQLNGMSMDIVVGMFYGDEGKGNTVNWLCDKARTRGDNPIVIRFSGGPQAGHTVVHEGETHVFSHFGAGSLQGVPTYWSKYCLTEPGSLVKEREAIKKITGQPPILLLDMDSQVITPYDRRVNQKESQILPAHDTCGMGIGKTMERVLDGVEFTVQDLIASEFIVREKLKAVWSYYLLKGTDERFDEEDFKEEIEKFVKYASLINDICMCAEEESILTILRTMGKNHLIFEGSQGILLDAKNGFYPYVTYANTTSENAMKLIETWGLNTASLSVFHVSRAYLTRHGDGPMSVHENVKPDVVLAEETNEFNEYQGSFRTCIYDRSLARHAIALDEKYLKGRGDRHRVVTCLDQFKHKLQIGYGTKLEEIRGGYSIEEFVQNIADEECKNVIPFFGADAIVARMREEDLRIPIV